MTRKKAFSFPFLPLFLLGLWFTPSAAIAAEKPNVIFVIFDDLNDWINGMDGHPQSLTPNLDRLRAKGVTFTNAHCTSPICAPSRPSMLTGLYPSTSGYFDEDGDAGFWYDNPVYKNAKTWIQFFRENGYDVYGTGKIYHQRAVRTSDFVATDGGDSAYVGNQNFGPYATQNGTNGTTYPGQEYRGKEGFWASLADIPYPAPGGWKFSNSGSAKYNYVNDDNRDPLSDEISATYAAGKLGVAGRTKPFMINIGFNRPHVPLTAPQLYFDLYPLATLQLATIKPNDADDCARVLHYVTGNTLVGGFSKYKSLISNGHLAKFTQAYLANITFADAQLGVVLDALESSTYADNTYVIATSDHGYHIGEKEYGFKNSLWEESTRVPLIMAGPGIVPGGRVANPASTVNIYPTLLDLCDLPAQPHPSIPLDGHSLVPLLQDPENGQWDGAPVALTVIMNPVYTTTTTVEPQETDPAWQEYSVRSERYRYTLCTNSEEELYDHETDPNEWINLAADPGYADLKRSLRYQMEKLVRQPLGAEPKAAKILSVVASVAANSYVITFRGDVGASFFIEVSSDLLAWSSAGTVTAAAGDNIVTVTAPDGNTQRFWRFRRDQ